VYQKKVARSRGRAPGREIKKAKPPLKLKHLAVGGSIKAANMPVF